MLPKEGEPCSIVVPGFGKSSATRVDNPCSLWHVKDEILEKCLAFEIYLENKGKIIKAFPDLRLRQRNMTIPPTPELQSLQVSIELRASTSTRDAELNSLYTLERGRQGDRAELSQRQIEAYKYFVFLGSPTAYMRLFDRFPHMLDPVMKPETTSPRLVELFQSLNIQQKLAFNDLLSKIKNGICIVHGCPGAGKTHFNLMLAAALQLKDEIMLPGAESPIPRSNRVLYLIDINRPLNDTANKMARLYEELGFTKECRIDQSRAPRVAIRMHCWSYEEDHC